MFGCKANDGEEKKSWNYDYCKYLSVIAKRKSPDERDVEIGPYLRERGEEVIHYRPGVTIYRLIPSRPRNRPRYVGLHLEFQCHVVDLVNYGRLVFLYGCVWLRFEP